jgi:hypothetical protein
MFNRYVKGSVILGMGLILLLHTLGIITTGLNVIIIIGAALLMLYGFVELDGLNTIKRLLHKLGIK